MPSKFILFLITNPIAKAIIQTVIAPLSEYEKITYRTNRLDKRRKIEDTNLTTFLRRF